MIKSSAELADTESNDFAALLVEHLQKFARRRNIKALFCLVLAYMFIVMVVVSVFSYVEIQVYRFNEPLLFDVLYTVLLIVFLVLFYGLHAVVYFVAKEDYPFIYDKTLIRNIQAQYTINWCLPALSFFIIFIRWTYYAQIGNSDNFHTVPGFFYGNMSFLCFILGVLGILIIVVNSASFYYVFVPPAKNQIFEKEKYKPNPYFEFHELEDENGRKFYSVNMK